MELRVKNIRLEFDLCMHKHTNQGHPAAPVSGELTEGNITPAPKPSASNPQEKEAAIEILNNQLKKVLIENTCRSKIQICKGKQRHVGIWKFLGQEQWIQF